MTGLRLSPRGELVLVVGAHHLVVGLHAAAHESLRIPLTPFQTVFVAAVIVVAPVVAVALLFTGFTRLGPVLLLGSMLGSLVFGLVSHAVLPGPDNVLDVGSGSWAVLFQVTGVLLTGLEALGAWRAERHLRPESQTS